MSPRHTCPSISGNSSKYLDLCGQRGAPEQELVVQHQELRLGPGGDVGELEFAGALSLSAGKNSQEVSIISGQALLQALSARVDEEPR